MNKRLVFVLVAALVAAMTAGVAQAKGKPAKKPPVVVHEFRGTIASADAASGSVAVDVKQTNQAARLR